MRKRARALRMWWRRQDVYFQAFVMLAAVVVIGLGALLLSHTR